MPNIDSLNIYDKFSYVKVSDPEYNLNEKLKQFWFIYSNNKNKSAYVNDCKAYYINPTKDIEKDRNKMNTYVKCFMYSDIVFLGGLIYSLNLHNKKGYLNTNSKLLNLYIIGKFMFYTFSFYTIKFYILKSFADPLLFDYYSIKEEQVKKSKEITSKDAELTINKINSIIKSKKSKDSDE